MASGGVGRFSGSKNPASRKIDYLVRNRMKSFNICVCGFFCAASQYVIKCDPENTREPFLEKFLPLSLSL